MVRPGCRLIDIGCDHAYLPIKLVASGISPSAMVTDISPAAVERARINIEAAHLRDAITAQTADGLEGYEPAANDLLIISGMGGQLIIHILEAGEACLDHVREMILSPQSEVPAVRRWLAEHGFKLITEQMVCDQHKYYTILKAAPGTEDIYAEDERVRTVQFAYGPYLIRNRDSVLAGFLRQEIGRLDNAIREVSQSTGSRARDRVQVLTEQKEAACSVMKSLTI